MGDGGDAVVAGTGGAAVNALPAQPLHGDHGAMGSGKSTLMHVLAGLDEPTGAVWIDGVEITALKERQLTQLRRDKIGFIFQTSTCCRCSPPRRTSCCR